MESTRKRKKRGAQRKSLMVEQVFINDATMKHDRRYENNVGEHFTIQENANGKNDNASSRPSDYNINLTHAKDAQLSENKKSLKYGAQLSSRNLSLPTVNMSRLQHDNSKQTISAQLQPKKSETKLPLIHSQPNESRKVPSIDLYGVPLSERSLPSTKSYPQGSNSARPSQQNQYYSPKFANKGDPVAQQRKSLPGPKAAVKHYREKNSHLTPYEKAEILHYRADDVLYTGANAKKIKTDSSQPNHGTQYTTILFNTEEAFDDDKGDYKVVVHDHIAYRYEILGIIGKGSFGQVLKVFDHRTNKVIALKAIRNKQKYYQQALIEIKLLEFITNEDRGNKSNVIHLLDSFLFRNHCCITFELLGMNLYEVLRSKEFRGLSLDLVKTFAIQLLNALQFLNEHHVIHCDLKPENILLNEENRTQITVIDIGSSCFENEAIHTYIQSRFYRAPEVILGMQYTTSIDMWSLGCVLAELYTGSPLFPGENEADQLACIMEIFGLPPQQMLDDSVRRDYFFDSCGNPKFLTNNAGVVRIPCTRDLADAIYCKDPLFLSFLAGCLKWDTKERMTPSQALQHQWIAHPLYTEVSPMKVDRPVHYQEQRFPTSMQNDSSFYAYQPFTSFQPFRDIDSLEYALMTSSPFMRQSMPPMQHFMPSFGAFRTPMYGSPVATKAYQSYYANPLHEMPIAPPAVT